MSFVYHNLVPIISPLIPISHHPVFYQQGRVKQFEHWEFTLQDFYTNNQPIFGNEIKLTSLNLKHKLDLF